MGETFTSFAEWLHKRSTTSILGTYFGFWAIMHWQLLYITIFVSEDKIYNKFGLLKNEYINIYFLEWQGYSTIIGYIIPIVLTYLFIWVLPKYLFMPAFKEERSYKTSKQIVVLQNDTKIEKEKAKLAQQNAEKLEAEVKIVKAEKEIEDSDPDKMNKTAYEDFVKIRNSANVLRQVKDSIYNHNGHIKRYYDGSMWNEPPIDTDSVALAHTNNLIEFGKLDGEQIIQLTEKGKYFLRRFTGSKNYIPF